jgi:hypothetical protein
MDLRRLKLVIFHTDGHARGLLGGRRNTDSRKKEKNDRDHCDFADHTDPPG